MSAPAGALPEPAAARLTVAITSSQPRSPSRSSSLELVDLHAIGRPQIERKAIDPHPLQGGGGAVVHQIQAHHQVLPARAAGQTHHLLNAQGLGAMGRGWMGGDPAVQGLRRHQGQAIALGIEQGIAIGLQVAALLIGTLVCSQKPKTAGHGHGRVEFGEHRQGSGPCWNRRHGDRTRPGRLTRAGPEGLTAHNGCGPGRRQGPPQPSQCAQCQPQRP